MARREAIMSVIVSQWGGIHPGAWRHPEAPHDVSMDFEQVKSIAQLAERGAFHTFFVADSLGHNMEPDPEVLRLTSNAVKLEPFTMMAALSMCTNNIGLALTASTTYSEPYNIARMLASLDNISGGRACWNVVASTGEAAPNSIGSAVGHDERYERATEFYDVVEALWDSWEPDAFLRDKASGEYFDLDKLHIPHHKGKFFQVEGPLNCGPPLQGHPIIAQAGSSPAGIALAGRIADLMFTFDQGIPKGQELYAKAKETAASNGRDPEHLKVLPAALLVLGRTQAEADDRLALLDDLADPRVGIQRLNLLLDFDLSPYSLDGPVPVDDVPETESGIRSAQAHYLHRARTENLTVRQLAKIAMQFECIAMGIDEVVDYIDERVTNKVADGFNLCFGDASWSLELFVDHAIPKLQARGLARTGYRPGTLRDNLGLPMPARVLAGR